MVIYPSLCLLHETLTPAHNRVFLMISAISPRRQGGHIVVGKIGMKDWCTLPSLQGGHIHVVHTPLPLSVCAHSHSFCL